MITRTVAVGAQPAASATNSNRRCALSTDLWTRYQALDFDHQHQCPQNQPMQPRRHLVKQETAFCRAAGD
jgi:hypothetical protein